MRDLSVFEQHGYAVRFGWGPNGLRRLAPLVEAVVIVDVLSFSTSVDIAVERGVTVFPYRWHNGTEHDYAASVDAVVADKTGTGWSLRPGSLVDAPRGLRLVLPSPNGSALTFGAAEAGATTTIVGCLRNASAIGRYLANAESVAVIAAGERWNGVTGPLRPGLEDHAGAGRIIAALPHQARSPEADSAGRFADVSDAELARLITDCGSGRELIARGRAVDVDLAVEIDCSTVVPLLEGAELTDATGN